MNIPCISIFKHIYGRSATLGRKILLTIVGVIAVSFISPGAVNKPKTETVDLEKIRLETTSPDSKFYYPKLLKMFMSNDTLMDNDDYRYFYYGTLFQEDFDPYRPTIDPDEYQRLDPLYYKSQHTRAEKDAMQNYALAALRNNPLDLVQLKNLVYVYEKKQKVNLAKIWKHKLNRLLRTIASSGTGADPENAWLVVYPRHEYDFLNLSGIVVQAQDFVPPYYEKVSVQKKSDKDADGYYFNIGPLLEQYYLKHPSEK